ncbi:hypothetical protein EIN_062720 [Entamoeba invadens IP1]|uniref:hypothetical protein n=1 Tax=Entamoeba invadens IP1 TaxID=370355 RepID=UPI0002C3D987|nr:hypothetical protein EIN_062720 [Entamoeba invadens IP1]ELP93577.1 hypothetical protein EIN_062720 [Entamoeba invadens IP1]|eukprot:XP_004260348.1 hypothetical protein EIN_062720 [Entamoeba invadens IP1]
MSYRVVVIDNQGIVREDSVKQVFENCGKISKIEAFESQKFSFFLVDFCDLRSAQTSLFLTGTLIDGSRIDVSDFQSFQEKYPDQFKPVVVIENEQIETDKSELKISLKELKQSDQNTQTDSTKHDKNEIVESAESALYKLQMLIVDGVCGARDTYDELLRKDEKKDKFEEMDVKKTEHSEFKPNTFIVQQKKPQKPLPPLPTK